MNHISVASPLLPASLQTEEPAYRSAPDLSHVSDSPTSADVGDRLWCVHSSGCAQLGAGRVGAAGHWGCTAPGMPGEPCPKQMEVINL